MIAVTALLLASAAPVQTAAQAVKVRSAEFYSETVGADGPATSQRTNIIPHRLGSCYSWILRVDRQERSIVVREQFDLPAPATRWGPSAGVRTEVAGDKASATSDIPESLDDGILTNGWCVAEGDPVGKYVITVEAEGVRLHRFEFVVVEESY